MELSRGEGAEKVCFYKVEKSNFSLQEMLQNLDSSKYSLGRFTTLVLDISEKS